MNNELIDGTGYILSKNFIPEHLKPVVTTITSSLPNSITPQNVTKASTNIINNNRK